MEIIRCKNLTQKPSGRERRRKKGERRMERIKRKKEKKNDDIVPRNEM